MPTTPSPEASMDYDTAMSYGLPRNRAEREDMRPIVEAVKAHEQSLYERAYADGYGHGYDHGRP